APNPAVIKTGTRPRATHEVPLLTATANLVINIEDPATATESSGTLSTIEKSPLDFDNENPSQQTIEGDVAKNPAQETMASETLPPGNSLTTRVTLNRDPEEEVSADAPLVSKRRRKRGNDGENANAPPKETLAGIIDPDPLSYANSQSVPERDVAQSSKGDAVARDPESEHTSFTSMVGSPGNIYQPEWGVTNGCRLDTPEPIQHKFGAASGNGIAATVENLEALLEAKIDMKKAAEANNVELSKELESLCAKFSDLQVNNNQLSQQVASLQAQVTDEERIKAAFKEFKKYEDDRVSSRCAEMNSQLDALSIDFDEELYLHMLTAIVGRRWVIGHGLRLAILKCAKSLELRQAFANVVSVGIAKGYDPEAEDKFMATMQVLKDLKYPLIDELEKLKDAPMDIIMASLYLESDTGEDAPQWIRDLRPSSSQLKIPVYPEVRDLRYPWAVKEEMLL
ncbi:hypothetical protein Tco_1196815, partial [Tanacetum coccineum]